MESIGWRYNGEWIEENGIWEGKNLQWHGDGRKNGVHTKRNSMWLASVMQGLRCLEGHLKTHFLCPAAAAAAAKSLQSCPTLCDPIDGSPQGSPIPGILQARTLEWVAISFSNTWKWKVKVKSLSRPSDPVDCSLPGSSVHGIFQAKVLEWGAIAFSIFVLRDRQSSPYAFPETELYDDLY